MVCHGTDTLAYTASALSYLIQNSLKPIVITGAQKPIDLEITDAKTNLSTAASTTRRTVSILCLTARSLPEPAAKRNAPRAKQRALQHQLPYIATIRDSNIIFYLDDKDQVSEDVTFYHKLDSKVTLLKLIPSMNGGILDYLFKHYDAVIIESFGVGGIATVDDSFLPGY